MVYSRLLLAPGRARRFAAFCTAPNVYNTRRAIFPETARHFSRMSQLMRARLWRREKRVGLGVS